MAKIPKFNLTMDGELVRSIEELQNNFSVDDILDHFESKRLHKWLKSRGYTDYLTKVESIEYDDKTAIIKPLMDIFEIDYSDEDLSDILDQLKYVPDKKNKDTNESAQKDMTKSTIDPLSSYRSSSVNLDYESQKYDELVKEIINDPENLELIKKNIDLLASKYYAFFSRDALNLFYKLSKHSHLALFAILDNPKALKPYLPFFGIEGHGYDDYCEEIANVRDDIANLYIPDHFDRLFYEIAKDIFCEDNIAENYKLFHHIKKAVRRCKTTSFAIVLSSENFVYKNYESYSDLHIYRKIDGKKEYSGESYIYYVDLADYDLPKEYMDEFYESCPKIDKTKGFENSINSINSMLDSIFRRI